MTKAQAQALAAAIVALGVAASVYVKFDGSVAVERNDDAATWECVVPDCRDVDGKWNDRHAPVDCLRSVPGPTDADESKAVPRWVGCNTIPKAKASGLACLSAPCSLEESGGEKAEAKAVREKVKLEAPLVEEPAKELGVTP